MRTEEIFYIPLDEITPDPNQPRKRITEEMIKNVAETIKTQGIINPIEIDGDNVIVTGEIRWKSAKEAGAEEVPCRRWVGTPEERLERQTIENLHHYGLTSIERENAIYGLWRSGRYKSKEALASCLGYKRDAINVIVSAKEFRDEYLENVDAVYISTAAIRDTRGLKPEQRVAILEKLAKGEITASQIPSYVEAAKKSATLFRSMIREELSKTRGEELVQVIGELEDRGVEVSEEMIGRLVEETIKDENIIERHKFRYYEEVIGVMTGEREPRQVIMKSPLSEFRRILTIVNRWGFEDVAQMGKAELDEARTILHNIRDKVVGMLKSLFGEADIVVETKYKALDSEELSILEEKDGLER